MVYSALPFCQFILDPLRCTIRAYSGVVLNPTTVIDRFTMEFIESDPWLSSIISQTWRRRFKLLSRAQWLVQSLLLRNQWLILLLSFWHYSAVQSHCTGDPRNSIIINVQCKFMTKVYTSPLLRHSGALLDRSVKSHVPSFPLQIF